MARVDLDEAIEHDFSRPVWCVLGLPFDAVTLEQAADEVVAAVQARRPCFLSTPNLNFVCAAQADPAFRQSVVNSDLSVVDGFPIVAVARLLGIPLPERVGGSNLVEHLHRRATDAPLKVFFFGGEAGAGALASAQVNRRAGGLRAVGHYDPGFGPVEAMATPAILAAINAQPVDFFLVSLGAKKGQAWIEANRQRVNAPAISHLGAVINFFAGTVKRAPVALQRTGLEWLWRIYQEPALWRRYWQDGLGFLGLLAGSVLPYWLWLAWRRPRAASGLGIQVAAQADACTRVSLHGSCTAPTIQPLRAVFRQLARERRAVVLDLQAVAFIDAAFLGLCLVLHKHLNAAGQSLRLTNANPTVRRIMAWSRVSNILT